MRGSRSRTLHDRAVINCQYSMATFSMSERKRRPHGDRKSTEMSLHLKQTFEAAVMTQLYPRSQIDIYVKVNVLQWDVLYFTSKGDMHIFFIVVLCIVHVHRNHNSDLTLTELHLI